MGEHISIMFLYLSPIPKGTKLVGGKPSRHHIIFPQFFCHWLRINFRKEIQIVYFYYIFLAKLLIYSKVFVFSSSIIRMNLELFSVINKQTIIIEREETIMDYCGTLVLDSHTLIKIRDNTGAPHYLADSQSLDCKTFVWKS